MTDTRVDVLIVGAGPAGLACAIATQEHGLSTVVLEKGSVVDAIRRFPSSMTFFSSSDLLEIGGVPLLSSALRPTREEALRYYTAVSRYHSLNVKLHSKVERLVPSGKDFLVETSGKIFKAEHVVIATGYFDDPRPFKVPGCDLPKVHRFYDEPYRYAGLDVAVVGGRNSAAEIALDLYRNGSRVTLVHRGEAMSNGVKYWVLPDIENRISRHEIRGLFRSTVQEIRPRSLLVQGPSGLEEIPNDAVFVMIGYSPVSPLLSQAGVTVDVNTGIPTHDVETMETNVPRLYVAGSLAAGNFNNRIFIENGRMHGGLIVRAIMKNR